MQKLLGKDYENVITTLPQEEIKFVVNGLKAKGINNETCAEVLKYLTYNKLAFGDILDSSAVAKRIVLHLNSSIGSLNFLETMFGTVGGWASESGRILLSGRYKRGVKLCVNKRKKRAKQNALNSCIYHELDHCATTNKQNMPSQSRLNNWFRRNDEDPKEQQKTINFLQSMDSGIACARSLVDSDLPIEYMGSFIMLNEGITVYKQHKYDKLAFGKESPVSKDYEFYKAIAGHIANCISEEKLIQFQSQGNYKKIREEYQLATGRDLNKIIRDIHAYGNIYDYHDRYYFRYEYCKSLADVEQKIKNSKETSEISVELS